MHLTQCFDQSSAIGSLPGELPSSDSTTSCIGFESSEPKLSFILHACASTVELAAQSVLRAPRTAKVGFFFVGRAAEISRLPMPRGSWLQQRMNDDQLGFLSAVFTVLDSSVVHCPLSMDTSTAKVRSRLPTRKTTIASESDRPSAKPR